MSVVLSQCCANVTISCRTFTNFSKIQVAVNPKVAKGEKISGAISMRTMEGSWPFKRTHIEPPLFADSILIQIIHPFSFVGKTKELASLQKYFKIPARKVICVVFFVEP